jgi:metal iron transporter
MKGLRLFEIFVTALVLAVVVCFCIQLSLIKDTAVGTVFRGYLPSADLVESNAYASCLLIPYLY